ncbi:hypothetical protein [Hydrogenophaga sp. PBL-H3]|uniref:hypothetical protein n=1 Tax=Hydrogenophaga sp. PBL-H3 TaxID=434010 RepID=UPI00131F4C59|nr:hypothetical protein [Hydrogenophaga sp. PBL-H3]QHE76190.1 hypothetical protein F9Z45_09015 [Hydrogenophaga sp. PBL-H3]QHE80614.1 hypothetical protein F9Z44_09015 [Hydrogenophaga sp. PBL-H3]
MNAEPHDGNTKPQGNGPAVQIDLESACQPVPRLLFVEAARRALKLMGNKLQTDRAALEPYPVIPGIEDLPSLELGMQYLQHQFVAAGQPKAVAMAAALRFVAVMFTRRYQYNFQDLRVGHDSGTLFWAPSGPMLAAAANIPLQLWAIDCPRFNEEELIQASHAIHRNFDHFDEGALIYIERFI